LCITTAFDDFFISNTDEGPPSRQRSVNADGSCGNGWVCEHRWRQITNMAAFAAAAEGTTVHILLHAIK